VRTQAQLGEFAKAENLWHEVAQQAPWFAPAWHGLVNLLLQQGKSDDAFHYVEMLQSQHEMNCEASLLRRSVLVSRAAFQTVRDELDRAA
jgi:uncharacterized protein HemY